MKKKLSIPEKLAKRKYKSPSRPVVDLYRFLINFITTRYNTKLHIVDSVNKCKTGCFVIFNHLSRLDHTYIVKATWPRRTNMVAGYSEFSRKKFSFIFGLNKVIPKKQYCADSLAVRAMGRVIKNGGCVTFAPEGIASDYGGNRPIVPGTSKLFKHYKVPVYFCKLEGQYLQNTKVCLDERYGETHATMTLLFSAEDVQKLSVEEMDDIINEKFRRNEYTWGQEKNIKWKTRGRICHRLEDFCYKCPKCGKEFTMVGEKDHIVCTNCGNGATMDDYYRFHPFEGAVIPETPFDWVEKERLDLIHEIRENPDYALVDEVEIGNLDKYKLISKSTATSNKVGKGVLTIDHKGMHYVGTRNGEPYEFHVDYKKLYTIFSEVDTSYFSFYLDGEYFDIFPKNKVVGKITLLIQEMHRYHVNYYKNFKWNDWMYEGLELGIDEK